MTPLDLARFVRLGTKTDAASFPGADLIALANPVIEEFAERIAELGEDHLGVIYDGNLAAGVREYAFPADLLTIKAVEARLDGETWARLPETDLNLEDIPTASEADLQAFWAGRKPACRIFRRSIFLLSDVQIREVEGGMRLTGEGYPWLLDETDEYRSLASTRDLAEWSPDGRTPGLPRPFHRLLGRRVIAAWKAAYDKPIALTEREDALEFDARRALSALRSINHDRSIELGPPPLPLPDRF